MLYLLLFPLQQWFKNAPNCYVIRTLPVLLRIRFNIISRIATVRCFIHARRTNITVTRNSHFMIWKFVATRSWIYARFPYSLFRRIAGYFEFKFLDTRWRWVTASLPGHFVTKSPRWPWERIMRQSHRRFGCVSKENSPDPVRSRTLILNVIIVTYMHTCLHTYVRTHMHTYRF
jgi:hypothetical protein